MLPFVNKCKIFKMLIEMLFLRLFEPDQSEIKEIFQEIVNIHNGGMACKFHGSLYVGNFADMVMFVLMNECHRVWY